MSDRWIPGKASTALSELNLINNIQELTGVTLKTLTDSGNHIVTKIRRHLF